MKIAFITNQAERCGVHQFGEIVLGALQAHSAHDFVRFALDGEAAFRQARDAIAACDLALCNYHPGLFGFLDAAAIGGLPVPVVALLHEFDPVDAHAVGAGLFPYRLVPDPSFVSRVPGVWAVPRIIPQTAVQAPRNDVPVIGSMGFATPGKNFREIVRFAGRHFPRARVRLHIPASFYADADGDGARRILDECRAAAGGVEVETSSAFLDADDLVRFLAGNDLNVLLYDHSVYGGLSSVADFAIAAERPLVLSDSDMFRHLWLEAPEFFLSRTPVPAMLETGAAASRRLKARWTPAAAARVYDGIFGEIAADRRRPRAARANTVLDDGLRRHYASADREIQSLCPDAHARKIPQANVQQAFVMAKVEECARPGASILCVGCHEDTAYFALAAKGHAVDAIDPEHNTDLEGYFAEHGGKRFYDVVFSTSVIEHVEDDERFIARIVSFLAPGGTAVLTMDYKNGYKPGERIPATDQRLYDAEAILGRLVPRMHGCRLTDIPDWTSYDPDFLYEGCRYGFATLVFRRNAGPAGPAEACFERLFRADAVHRRVVSGAGRRGGGGLAALAVFLRKHRVLWPVLWGVRGIRRFFAFMARRLRGGRAG